MKLKKFLPLIDFLTKVEIWTQDCGDDDDAEPMFAGLAFDIPWVYLNMKIARPEGETDEPIYIYTDKENQPVMVINLLEE